MEPKISRKAKDHVFVDMFNRKEYCLELFHALHPEAVDVTVDDIDNITISHVVVDKPYNDLGFTVRDRLLVLVEAQSTWYYNILIRMLLYHLCPCVRPDGEAARLYPQGRGGDHQNLQGYGRFEGVFDEPRKGGYRQHDRIV